jgi:hypothetical protein
MHIDVGQVLDRLRAAAEQTTLSRYLVACATVQFWADLVAVCGRADAAKAEAEPIEAELRRAEVDADQAAQALFGDVRVESPPTDGAASVCIPLSDHSPPELLSKPLYVPMPECCGYDLADLDLIAGDGERLTEQIGVGRPVLIVGIRTGGAYLAPLWKAVLKRLGVADAHWCTVRPQATRGAVDGVAFARAWLERRLQPVVVVVDDQPDTGTAMESVAAALRAPCIDLWFSCVGKLWCPSARRPAPASPRAFALRKPHRPRLWECLLPRDHPTFIARLRCTQGLPTLPHDVELKFHCTKGEARYGAGRAWLPWNDPRVPSGRRRLVNPRKTPLVALGPGGDVLLHLRFIGESAFGRAEFERVQEMIPARRAWFLDGYLVTEDIGPAESFRVRFHAVSPSVREDLLVQVADWLTVMTRQPMAQAHGSPVVLALWPRWSAIMDLLHARCGRLPEMLQSLRALLSTPTPWLGQSGKAIRSSLRYACGAWHWQVDGQGKLHRFQLEANWGDVSFPELELAAFSLENCLTLVHARQLASLCGFPYSSIRQSLPLAALMIAEARARSASALSDVGRIALLRDFEQLLSTVSELAAFETP